MRNLKRLAVFVMLPAILAMLLVACGGDSDNKSDDSNNGGPAASDSKDNGKKSDGGDIKASGDTGSDEKYVAAVCKSGRKFLDDLTASMSKIDYSKIDANDPDSMAKLMEPFTGTFRQFAKDLADAKPPKDLKDWHGDLVDNLNQMVKAMEKGDQDALDTIGVDFPDMPEDVSNRLSKVAEKNDDCKAMEEESGSSIFDPTE